MYNARTTACNSERTAYNARTTAYRQNAVWSLTPAMAFHKRNPKMKDDHIACLPYACLLGKNSLPARKQCIVVGQNTPKRSRFHLHITEAQRRQHKITFVFCILCFIFCIFVFYILYFCVLYFVFLCFIFCIFVFYIFCILYFVFYILYFIFLCNYNVLRRGII
jgi:hypothetical protein